jgi:hypothetical protein
MFHKQYVQFLVNKYNNIKRDRNTLNTLQSYKYNQRQPKQFTPIQFDVHKRTHWVKLQVKYRISDKAVL